MLVWALTIVWIHLIGFLRGAAPFGRRWVQFQVAIKSHQVINGIDLRGLKSEPSFLMVMQFVCKGNSNFHCSDFVVRFQGKLVRQLFTQLANEAHQVAFRGTINLGCFVASDEPLGGKKVNHGGWWHLCWWWRHPKRFSWTMTILNPRSWPARLSFCHDMPMERHSSAGCVNLEHGRGGCTIFSEQKHGRETLLVDLHGWSANDWVLRLVGGRLEIPKSQFNDCFFSGNA